jgi:hypothetical protein
MIRDQVIEILHRYRRGEIASADEAAEAIMALFAPRRERELRARMVAMPGP